MKDVIGHSYIRNSFKKAVERQSLSHAHLIVGEDGIGKSVVGKELALNILEKNEDKYYVDLIEFKSNKKTIGVEDIRGLIEEINKKPFEGNKKVILVYKADTMTTQGQNAFLKTIEEPPKGVYIILLCENIENILQTIKSRCQIHKLNRLSLEEIKSYLEKYHFNENPINKEVAIAFSNGIPGKMDRFLKDDIFNEVREFVVKLLKEINSKDINIVIKYVKYITENYKDYYSEVLDNILYFSRDILLYKDIKNPDYVLNKDKIEDIIELSRKLSFNKINNIINNLNNTRDSLRKNVNALITFDVMLLNILEV